MQSTFKNIRIKILTWLFHTLLPMYSEYFKKSRKSWNIGKTELLEYPKNTLGFHLGIFLIKHQYELMPKLENHDCFHVLTGLSTTVKDEIALQYLCFGNGERNITAILVMLSGSVLLPEYFEYYKKAFRKGKRLKPFYHINFNPLLKTNLHTIQSQLLWKN